MFELHPTWSAPPSEWYLPSTDVHIWQASLQVTARQQERFTQMLSADEMARATRFHFPQHREHYIAGRGLLREILSRYQNCLPEAIRFSYNSFGKPALLASAGQDALQFNISHSHGVALFAFVRGVDIGIDVQHTDAVTDLLQAGAVVFSTDEMEVLRALPPERRRARFFQFWTRKEAYIKAVGGGFSLPLNGIDVSRLPAGRVWQAESPGAQFEQTDWNVWDFTACPGYAAAVAIKKEHWRFVFYQLGSTCVTA